LVELVRCTFQIPKVLKSQKQIAGPSGHMLIRECLQADHTVVIYARSPEKLSEDVSNHRNVVIIKGSFDPEDEDSLSKSMEGVHAVVSALGPPTAPTKAPFHPKDTPLAHAYSRIIRVMHAHNVKRLIALGTASIKDANDKFSVLFFALINGVKTLAYNAYKDVVAIGDTIRGREGRGLIWTIARVPVLTNSESKDVIAGYVGDNRVGGTLSRAGFAAFVVGELEKNEWVKKAPLISSP
jgi:hypothetical protein